MMDAVAVGESNTVIAVGNRLGRAICHEEGEFVDIQTPNEYRPTTNMLSAEMYENSTCDPGKAATGVNVTPSVVVYTICRSTVPAVITKRAPSFTI